MTASKMGGEQPKQSRWNVGDALHLGQILLLVLALGMYYQQMQDGLAQVRSLEGTVTRIEHYLSSKDPRYWDNPVRP